jgi:hypothetical protein
MATELDETFDDIDVENDLPAFLFLVLDNLEEFFSNISVDINHIQAQYLIVDRTVNLLRACSKRRNAGIPELLQN